MVGSKGAGWERREGWSKVVFNKACKLQRATTTVQNKRKTKTGGRAGTIIYNGMWWYVVGGVREEIQHVSRKGEL